MELKFYKCNHCGNVITKVVDSKVPVMCCGEKMTELVAGSTDAATEKHVPVVETKNGKVFVTVGSVIHPMLEEHFIQFIAVETDKNVYIKYLKPNEEPKACFALCDGEKVVNVYEYCNLHGLWKA